jgi:hypothetical protein
MGQQAHLNSTGQCYTPSLTSGILDKVARIEERFAKTHGGGLNWDFEISTVSLQTAQT